MKSDIIKDNTELQRQFMESKIKLYEEIYDIFVECCTRNWDGYDGDPITANAYLSALNFASTIPLHLPMPTVCPVCYGTIDFEWYKDKDNQLSMGIAKDNGIDYAFIIKGKSDCGTSKFNDISFPNDILKIIEQIYEN